MPLSHIEHVLVATDDMARTRDWYCTVLGMEEGPHPDFGFPVCWLYLAGRDVVHIAPSAPLAGENQKTYLGRTSQDTGSGTGALDHVAFRATGLNAMRAHLHAQGVEFSERRASDRALHQIFLSDPNGIKIEINFRAEEALGFEPAATAADLART